MNTPDSFTFLQLRELFHLEFLRWFGRKIKAECYALKGGTNLRFFFKSFRYSEDMDLDARGIPVDNLKTAVMDILTLRSFLTNLKPFGIRDIVPPDMSKAKQTQTTQRFKIHLITSAGEDLFTKIEFSRRGFKGGAIVQPVEDSILRTYKLPPLLVSHYDVTSAVRQKIDALATRPLVQARDIFDLYILSSQLDPASVPAKVQAEKSALKKASENIFTVGFEQFRGTVIAYLAPEDRALYDRPETWDEVRLKSEGFLNQFKK